MFCGRDLLLNLSFNGGFYMTYLILVLAIFSEVSATLLLKMSDGWAHLGYGLGSIFLYALAGFFMAFVLKSMSVGLAYSIWSGLGVALVCAASVIFWGQRFDVYAIVGIMLIVFGTLLITVKSSVVIS